MTMNLPDTTSIYLHTLARTACGACPECNRRTVECRPATFRHSVDEVEGHLYECDACGFTRRTSNETLTLAAAYASEQWEDYPPTGP